MGAVICDAVLQAGLSYEATVRFRVVTLQEVWPDAESVSGFVARLGTEDLAVVLRLRNRRKLGRVEVDGHDGYLCSCWI